jgi:hypothetical protein
MPNLGAGCLKGARLGPTGPILDQLEPKLAVMLHLKCPRLVGHLGTCCPKAQSGPLRSVADMWGRNDPFGRYWADMQNVQITSPVLFGGLLCSKMPPPSSRCTSLRSVPSLAAKVPRRGTFGVGRFHRQSVSILKTWGTLRWI